jgi:cell division protease FtsH
MTAYHEAVTPSLVAWCRIMTRLQVSIIPRGRALGVTMYLPEQDRWSHSKQHLESMISSLYGGRLAEELIYGAEKVSTGASNDIERATDIARKMVTQWGMSSVSAPCSTQEDGEVFLGRSMAKAKHMSDDTARIIDAGGQAGHRSQLRSCQQILLDNMDVLHTMKDALMKYETIDAKQIDDLMARREVRAPSNWHDEHGDTPQGGASVRAGGKAPAKGQCTSVTSTRRTMPAK